MTTTLTPEALRALRCAEIDGNRLVLPDQLPRKVYEEVDKALTRLGGKWNRSARAHLRNPGVWPYVARCILPAGHDGPRADETQEWAP